MAWENNEDSAGGVWAVEGGAAHSARLARLGAWASLGGLQGVLGSTDLEVKPLDVPGTKIRVMPGACGVLAKHLNHGREMYLADLLAEYEVDVPASAGTPRSHLVIARVENPYLDGEPWELPPTEDRDKGPYIYARLVPDVPSDTTTIRLLQPEWSAITLARLDVPASTGTIDSVMVHDLRTLVNPLTGGAQGGDNAPTDQTNNPPGEGTVIATDTDHITFPFTQPWPITIPAAATHADLTVALTGIKLTDGAFTGKIRLNVGTLGAQSEKDFHFDYPGGPSRIAFTLTYPDLALPAAIRGTTQNALVSVRAAVGTGPGKLWADQNTQVVCTAKLKQKPVTTA